jgi:hypothetical protein
MRTLTAIEVNEVFGGNDYTYSCVPDSTNERCEANIVCEDASRGGCKPACAGEEIQSRSSGGTLPCGWGEKMVVFCVIDSETNTIPCAPQQNSIQKIPRSTPSPNPNG